MYVEHLHIPVGPGTLHVERVGRGDRPVVLLHGFATCAFLWRDVAPRLADAGFATIAMDLLGYGESERPGDAGYGIVAQAGYVDQAMTVLRYSSAVVVGQDIGAIVALQLAARHPERVERLALINPPSLSDLPGPEIRGLQRATARIALGAGGLFGAGPLLAPYLRGAVSVPDHMPDVLLARYLAPFVGSEGVDQVLLLARSLELRDEEQNRVLQGVTPALILRGEKSVWSSIDDVERLAALRPVRARTEVKTLQGAGDLAAEDDAANLAAILVDWINASVS